MNDQFANTSFFQSYFTFKIELNELTEFLEFHQKQADKSMEKDHSYVALNASVITLSTILNSHLKEYLYYFQIHTESKISYKDFRGDILKKFKLYANKVIDLEFDFNSSLWQYVMGFTEVRNCIVHNEGFLDEFNSRKVIENFAKNSFNFEIDELEFVNPTFEFCIEAIAEFDKFFIAICTIALSRFPGEHSIKNPNKYNLPILS